jgi:hypothetical protein
MHLVSVHVHSSARWLASTVSCIGICTGQTHCSSYQPVCSLPHSWFVGPTCLLPLDPPPTPTPPTSHTPTRTVCALAQVWSREGWLSYFAVSGNASPAKQENQMLFRSGMIDFAGSGE